ncbi:NAD+ synthase [Haladaptatus sp. DFWS20]|uniref:NAD+ synthase n=1 Tax=Haladaptatus sp. DFWS20 TaxID=3403467 RepID=UPI003EBB6BF4
MTAIAIPPAEIRTGDDDIEIVHQQVVLFIEEYVRQSDAEGVIVPMSGGIDSTLTAYLAVEALGPDRVAGLLLPGNLCGEESNNEARILAEALGIERCEIDLQPLLHCFTETVVSQFDDGRFDDGTFRALGNALSRLRMTCAYYEANVTSRLVVGTSNRSELLLGYFTKHGDGGADLLPLGDLYKTEVRALARRIGIPRRVVEKPATAELWAGQTDREELGAAYEFIDTILHYSIDRSYRAETIASELDVTIETVWDIVHWHLDTHHKRRLPAVPDAGFARHSRFTSNRER